MVEKVAVEEIQLVVFSLGQEVYAVDIALVKEIIQMQAITRVPGTPPSVEGVINLRGTVIPIVDLRKRFKLARLERDKDTRIVIVICKGQEVGVIVDSVAQVLRVPVDSIEGSANLFKEDQLNHIQAIVKLENQLVILLDIDQVLSREEVSAVNAMDLIKTRQAGRGVKSPILQRG
jgi:purine-binding chemotaxis protein CheW